MSLPEAYLREFAEPVGFMDHAAVSPPPRRVAAVLADVLAEISAPTGRIPSGIIGRYEAALAAMARFLGTHPERVTVTTSTSAALFQVAFGLLGAGGNVVVAAHEFPAVVYPWLRAEAHGGPQLRLVEVADRRVDPAALADAVDAATRAVAVSLVDFRSGFRADVAAIRETAPDALLVVDAIQGLGALAAPLAPADVLVAAGHKWMRAGWGSGVFAVSDRALDRLVPTLTGWWGVEEPFDFDTPPPHEERTDAERLHGGSPAVLGALAFAAAIEVIEIAGIAAIEEAVLDHASRVEEVLRDAGAAILDPWRSPQERSGIVSFSLPGEDPEATHARLGAAGIACTRYGSIIRLAVHASTDAAGFDLLAEAL